MEKPIFVSPLSINFAKVASKSNVQALKSLMWTELCNKRRGEVIDFEGQQHFRELVERIGEKAKEKEIGKELGDVSVAMCFISTLHLCHEKGLELQQDNIHELIIVKQ